MYFNYLYFNYFTTLLGTCLRLFNAVRECDGLTDRIAMAMPLLAIKLEFEVKLKLKTGQEFRQEINIGKITLPEPRAQTCSQTKAVDLL